MPDSTTDTSNASSTNVVSAITSSTQPQDPPKPQTNPATTVQQSPTSTVQSSPESTVQPSPSASEASAFTISQQPQSSPIPPATPATTVQPSPEIPSTASHSTKSPTLKYILITVAAIAILGGGGFAAYKFLFSGDSEKTAETNDAPPSINIDLPKETSTDETATDTGKFEELQSVVSELKDIYTEQPPSDKSEEENPANPPSLDFELSDETSSSAETEAPKTGVER